MLISIWRHSFSWSDCAPQSTTSLMALHRGNFERFCAKKKWRWLTDCEQQSHHFYPLAVCAFWSVYFVQLTIYVRKDRQFLHFYIFLAFLLVERKFSQLKRSGKLLHRCVKRVFLPTYIRNVLSCRCNFIHVDIE